MKIWLVTVGEPLPSDSGAQRIMRTGIVARRLAARGHDVVWWTARFDHYQKRMRSGPDEILIEPGLTIVLVRGVGYGRNVSVRRLVDHVLLGKEFRRQIQRRDPPDLIVAAYPTIELAHASVQYGVRNQIPIVLDVRDLWPDLFLDVIPKIMRRAAQLPLAPLYSIARQAFAGASAIIGTTDQFVQWGASLGERARGEFDRSFPMAYETVPDNSEAEMQSADTFWDSQGVRNIPGQYCVAFFGSIGRQADLAAVLQAAQDTQLQNFQFVICGRGDAYLDLLRKASRLPNVVVPGWIDRAKISSLLKRAHIGLVPYVRTKNYLENLPNKPIEYLSAGIPLLSALPDGPLAILMREYECGWVYRSSHELVHILGTLARDPTLLARAAEGARRLFHERFTAERIYGAMVTLFETIGEAPDPRRFAVGEQ